jgi:hypothetical protein
MSLKQLKILTGVFWSGTALLGVALMGTIFTGVQDYREEHHPAPVSIPLPAVAE